VRFSGVYPSENLPGYKGEGVLMNINTEINSPLSQFEIRDLLSLDAPNIHLSITNIGLFLTLGAFFILVIMLLSTNYNKLVGNK
jgi:hypothetical protein